MSRGFSHLWQDFKFAWEDCYMLELFSFLIPQLFTICHELIKQVVNNVCLEYLHTQRICQVLCIPLNLHIKCQNCSIPANKNNNYLSSCSYNNVLLALMRRLKANSTPYQKMLLIMLLILTKSAKGILQV